MKKIILDFETKCDNFKELVQEAFNHNFLNFLISKETIKEFEKIERLHLYSRDLDIPSKYIIYVDKRKLEKNLTSEKYRYKNSGFFIDLNRKEDEREIIELSKTGYFDFIIVSAKNWKIIPFENIIAEMHSNDTDLIALVDSIKEAQLVFNILEIGVDGILFKPKDVDDISKLKKLLQTEIYIKLTKAKITNIQSIAQIIAPLIATVFIDLGGLTLGMIFLNPYELIGYLAVVLGITLFILLFFDLKRHPYLYSYEKPQKESVDSN